MPLSATARTPNQDSFTDLVEGHLAQLESQLDRLKTQVRQAQQIAGLGSAAMMLMHEANNLLTPVLNFTQAALNADDVELMRKALRVTTNNSRMLVAMSERMLEIGAAKQGRPQRTLVREAAEEALASLCRDASKDGIQVRWDFQEEDVTVWIDPMHLKQVLFNLFLNAREAMAAGHQGLLTIRSRRDGDHVVIEIRDTGKGISSDLLPFVFEPLQTTKTAESRVRPRCGGLGLALCRDLIEEAGGTIEVASKPAEGTTFQIILRSDAEHRPQGMGLLSQSPQTTN